MKTLTHPIGALMTAVTIAFAIFTENAWSETARSAREFRPILVKNTTVQKTPSFRMGAKNSRVSGSKERLRKLVHEGRIKLVLSKSDLDALMFVESSGRNGLIGDTKLAEGEYAYGVLQIRQCYVTDVNRKFGTNLRSEDCQYDIELSKLITQAYMNIYGKSNFRFQHYARIHNGGPAGHLSTSTDKYWKKVIAAKLR